VDAVDVAPGKYFPEPEAATSARIREVKDWWADRGIALTGMQALLFGTTGLNVFGSVASQQALLKRLDAVARIAAELGATRLVFGSPGNRDCTGLSEQAAASVATEFFRRLGDVATSHGVVVCLEPNPTRYGCNFMTRIADTAEIVMRVAHPSIRLHLDIGAVTINDEDLSLAIAAHRDLVGHIHASEPDLVPIGDGLSDHAAAAVQIALQLPGHIVSIEMLATKSEPHLQSIERALRAAIFHYRAGGQT
jgi:sugar phosphate isomerase/epimerase